MKTDWFLFRVPCLFKSTTYIFTLSFFFFFFFFFTLFKHICMCLCFPSNIFFLYLYKYITQMFLYLSNSGYSLMWKALKMKHHKINHLGFILPSHWSYKVRKLVIKGPSGWDRGAIHPVTRHWSINMVLTHCFKVKKQHNVALKLALTGTIINTTF